MPANPKEMTTERLRIFIDNHRRSAKIKEPLCIEAMNELDQRLSQGLKFQTSFRIIRAAAKEGRFICYKDLADASGVDWGAAHYAINDHLWRLVEFAALKGWPMLSAVVVNKPNVDSGRMKPDTLKGFIQAARELGHDDIVDEEAFLRDQQKRVFDWAQESMANTIE